LYYYRNLIVNSRLEKQIKFLPTPSKPPIFWTKLEEVELHGSLNYSPTGTLILDGDWDINETYLLQSIFDPLPENSKKWDVHETIRQMFLFGKHYKTAPQYKNMIYKLKNGMFPLPQGCRNEEDIDNYFKNLEAAFNSMQLNGYLTQRELGLSDVLEIKIFITRDGKLCLGTGGNHRIRMAELLGFKWIPFFLKGVHPLYVKQLCLQSSLPPHQALIKNLNERFYKKKPQENC
jgi:hypothetical protein